MPKMKTHSGASKRFSKTATGKIKRKRQNARHILTKKSPKRKRRLGSPAFVSDADEKRMKLLIGF